MDDLPETANGEYDHDFRTNPDPYRVGRGEEGVFKVQPYKDELLPCWGYADGETAADAAEAIYEWFLHYRRDGEFVGMDMARKYLQMGYTRAMRYARYPGGRKYDEDDNERDPVEWADPDKRRAALVFHHVRQRVETDDLYQRRRRKWREQSG
ncbi:MAG: DUF4385 domain-containing protein [Halolamina sp.]